MRTMLGWSTLFRSAAGRCAVWRSAASKIMALISVRIISQRPPLRFTFRDVVILLKILDRYHIGRIEIRAWLNISVVVHPHSVRTSSQIKRQVAVVRHDSRSVLNQKLESAGLLG